ncbi:hypothetical protein RDI61_01480 [Pseudomonas plecoglossicida]|uniref:hypothetical protein n=1 Tax=Pseudomonas putida group TaxID=136845 RepID=UPI002410B070|nr:MULTISPECIES: hypothetical protein [Pseudomonas putida group]MDQ7962724.1 hypothetical protein [Pseudomonas plecoglossicida]WFG05278.1 hypothetical protein P3X84_11830 [Pseudomonas putida]
MRRFRTTAIILGVGVLISKFAIGMNASPLQNDWHGPVFSYGSWRNGYPDAGKKYTGLTFYIREYKSAAKTGSPNSVVMRFSGPKERLAALGVTDQPILCSIRKEVVVGRVPFPKRYELYNSSGGYSSYNLNSPFCKNIALEETGWSDLNIIFSDRDIMASVERHNARGLIIGYYQSSNFSEWMAGK